MDNKLREICPNNVPEPTETLYYSLNSSMIRGIHIVQISILDWLTALAKHAMCAETIYLLYVLDIVLS